MKEKIVNKSKEELISDIIQIEWKMLQDVHGIDGRAACQNNAKIFKIMRFSNYFPWSESLLQSYIHDLKRAEEEKRNLVLEKYAYMMSLSDSAYYKKQLSAFMPQSNAFTSKMIREIVRYLLDCEYQFQKNYPQMSSRGRKLNTSGLDVQFASIETYAIGELRTYSPKTLRLFLDFIRTEKAFHHNIVADIRRTMVKMYGFQSLEEAEQKLEGE